MTVFLVLGAALLVIAGLLWLIDRQHPGEPFVIRPAGWRRAYVWESARDAATLFAVAGGLCVISSVVAVL
jgi:uncharacterized membrane protein